jgi:AcrR family transcriptional regulator
VSAPTPTRRTRARRGEGDRLRAEILAAARDLLAETGSDAAVSIRSVADRAGVTPPSIYLHFPDKETLLESVCMEVFTALDEAMESAAAGTDDPFEALRARGLAYVRFALANPEQYRLVLMRRMRRDELDTGPQNLTELAEGPAFGHLLDSVHACQRAGVFDAGDDGVQVAISLWATAHGVAALLIAHPWLADDPEPLTELVIDSMGLGLAARRPTETG